MPSVPPPITDGMSDEQVAALRQDIYTPRARGLGHLAKLVLDLVMLPLTVVMVFYDKRVLTAAYGVTWADRYRIAWRMYRNTLSVNTGTSFKAHLVMFAKLLEVPPDVDGVVVECGSFQGGSAANLSLACEAVGRDLILYDSFAGMPPMKDGEHVGRPNWEGTYRGELEVVQGNIRRFGVIDRCTFRKGWFEDTLPHHTEPIVALFLDVDYQSSLHDCLINLWDHLVPAGYVFVDEYTNLDYTAVFFSDRYWQQYFDRVPPGLVGVGTGLPVGNYFISPMWTQSPIQGPASIAFTRKDFHGVWNYFPDPDRNSPG